MLFMLTILREEPPIDSLIPSMQVLYGIMSLEDIINTSKENTVLLIKIRNIIVK